MGVYKELEIFKNIKLLNILPVLTAPKRLQCLPRDLPRAAAKKRKRQSPTSPIASGKPAKKSLLNPKAFILRVELKQELILLNIFVCPLKLPISTMSSSQDFDDFNNFNDPNNSNDSLIKLNTQGIDFRLSPFRPDKEVDVVQTKTQVIIILPI